MATNSYVACVRERERKKSYMMEEHEAESCKHGATIETIETTSSTILLSRFMHLKYMLQLLYKENLASFSIFVC